MRNYFRHISLALTLLILTVINTSGQVDKKFWFVAPEVSRGHGDLPVVFRITTFDEEANVTISIPANPDFTPVTYHNIPPNTQRSYEITNRDILNLIENRPPATVNNKGILIESNVSISVYYEVANTVNPDKFTLKGSNALGREFFVPSQNNFFNWPLNPKAKERIDIVATENNTEVTITATDDVVRHSANSTFTIVLNRGQTYSLEAISPDIGRHLGGTHIRSNHPIAVTISDDSIAEENGQCYDLIGDQLIPVNLIGHEYIAIHALYGTGINGTVQKVYVVATQDNTFVDVDGASVGPLSRGEMTSFDITNNAIHILSTKPIYAYQVSGLPHTGRRPPRGHELGSALLPHIACTGSRKVSFTRTLNQRFFIQLLVQKKNMSSFIMRDRNNQNVTNNHLNNLNWVKVESTEGADPEETWYTGVRQLDLSTGNPYSIENTNGLFHLSIMDENSGSMSYGYFSAYSTIRINGPSMECKGNEVILRTDEEMKSYYWFSDKDIWNPIGTDPTLTILESGRYWVTAEVSFGGCFTTDTLEVEFKMPEFSLGEDQIVCPGEEVSFIIDHFEDDEDFEWTLNGIPTNNYTNQFDLNVDASTVYEIGLTVSDRLGCSNTHTVKVTGRDAAMVNWDLHGEDICIGDTIRNTTEMYRYEWRFNGIIINEDDDTQNFIVPEESGTYSLTVWTEDECLDSYSQNITVRPLPEITLDEIRKCPGESASISLNGYSSVLWQNSSTSSQIILHAPEENVWAEVTNEYGCVARDSTRFAWFSQEAFAFGSDTSVCINANINIEIDDQFNDYIWMFEHETDPISTLHYYDIESAHPALHEGTYTISAVDDNGCDLSHSFFLTVEQVPDLALIDKTNICRGDTIRIETPNHSFVRYEWEYTDNDGITAPFGDDYYALVAEPGTYSLTAWQANECTNHDDIIVTVIDQPVFDLSAPENICPETEFEMSLINWIPGESGDLIPTAFEWRLVNEDHPNEYSIESREGASYTSQKPGEYMLIAWDSFGCFSAVSASIEEYPLPEIVLSDSSFCDNSSIMLELPIELEELVNSYRWSRNNSADEGSENSSWTVTQSGTYALSITDLNDCSNASSLNLTHLPSPLFSLGEDREVCFEEIIEIEVDSSFTRYEWNGENIDDQPPYQVVTNSDTYHLEVWNNHGCSSSDAVEITVNPLPDIDLGEDLILCAGVRTELTVGEYEEIYWSTGAFNINSIVVNDGLYSVMVKDEKGCSNSDEIVITWRAVPKVDLGPDLTICPADFPLEISAPEGFEAYEWQNGSPSRTIYANILDTVNLVRVKDEFDCWGWDTKTVKFFIPPTYTASEDIEVCEPEEAILDAGEFIITQYHVDENITPIQGYRWSNGSAEQTISVTESGEYWVDVFDGCFTLRDTMQVAYHLSPIIIGLDTTFYTQVVVFVESGTPPYYYALNDNAYQDSPSFNNVPNGDHIVWVEDFHGCETFTTFPLNSDYNITVPNVFTPNGDGINDEWIIEGINRLPESVISVYDRYGKLLVKFKASDPPWDGTYMNRPLPTDDYWYVIHLKPVDKIYRGNVTIIR